MHYCRYASCKQSDKIQIPTNRCKVAANTGFPTLSKSHLPGRSKIPEKSFHRASLCETFIITLNKREKTILFIP